MDTLYDMHCHVGFTPDPLGVAETGIEAAIRALSCTVTPTEFQTLAPLLTPAPGIRVGLGVHPWWIADGRVDDAALELFCSLAPTTRFIGEIGLDFAGPRDTAESRTVQLEVFARILAACSGETDEYSGAKHAGADARGKASPKLLSVHAVNAAREALDALEATGALDRHHVVFHWFSGTSDDLQRALRAGCFFSVGPRMLASRRGREYARQIPLDRLLLETDMPARAGEPLPPAVWRAELDNALAGIAQLKNLDRAAVLEALNTTSAALLA